ncbi:MAG: DNA polymerase III subunit alpha [Candidatus Paceibacterota bacterium]|nr:MAG: DNA polymerase III subunit alpha [Candidatus Paceibacterota bacterium]
MRFTHLHTHSHYSLLDGLSKVDAIVSRVKEAGMDSVAITDHGVMYGAIEFYKKATKAGIKPIIGCEMYITSGSRHDKRPGIDDQRYHLILLAETNEGYRNLMKLVTAAHLEGFYYKPRIDKEILRQHSKGLIGLSACLAGEISRALTGNDYPAACAKAREYEDIFGKGNFFIELQQHTSIPDQNMVTPQLVRLARELDIPMVATQDSHYTHHHDQEAHDILLAVQTGNKLDDKDRFSMNQDDFSLLTVEEMREKFLPLGEDVMHEAFENTARIADRCSLTIEIGKTQLPSFPLPTGHTDAFAYLTELVAQGVKRRFGETERVDVTERIAYEMGVIKETGFASYFLIVQDFVNWAKRQGIIVGPGRGSAAGSLVAYVLNITNIDPLHYSLLFERFLNPARISMPDIDLDFADHRRDEVLHYVSEKYGKDHVAQIITFGTMAARGSIRDTGRALGLSYDFCDRVAKMIPFNPNAGGDKTGQLAKALESVAELKEAYDKDPDIKRLIDSAAKLEGVARHASTHACAVVISPQPLTEYLPLQQGTDDGDIITQYEMHAVEDLGLLKMDFLGLANLTIIERALSMIKERHNVSIDMDALPLDDAKAFKLLQEAKTTGVFQLESAGMKRYLKELRPTTIEDIIAMCALYRPGPMDLIPDYINRKHGRSKVTYLHPALEPILKNTYGIMVYQEQLMAAVRALAGFSLAEADIMRKAVGKKIKSLLDEQEGKFKDGCARVGTPKDVAETFWGLVEPFNRYAFNRSHAACYAVIAYQTAYLKANFPAEFMASFMNSETGDVERIAFLIDECRSMKIEVLPPDINQSGERFAVVSDSPAAIRFGLTAIKNVGEHAVQALIAERAKNGPFTSVADFVTRIPSKDLNKKSLESLIKSGALDAFGERGALLASMDNLLSYARDHQKNASSGQVSLFGEHTATALPPVSLVKAEPATTWSRLSWEKELLGLYVSEHPLDSFKTQLAQERVIPIKNIVPRVTHSFAIGGMVTRVQKIITKTGKPMAFLELEDLTGKMEAVVFPTVLAKFQDICTENHILVAQGKVNERDGRVSFLCDSLKSLAELGK